MPMCDLLEYSDNYSMASGGLWDYYGDEVNDYSAIKNGEGNKITKQWQVDLLNIKQIIQSMPNNNILHAEAVVPLKYWNTDYIFSWKSKGVYDSKRKPLYTAFWHSIKLWI